MADKKISALTAASTPLAGTEVLPIVQSGSTVKVAVSDLTAGRAVSASSLALTGSPLPTTSGGTALTSFTANKVVYSSSTSALSASGSLNYDGTNLGVGSTDYGNAGSINISVGVVGATVGGFQLWSTTTGSHYIQFGDGTSGDTPYRGYVGYNHNTDTLELGAAAATRATVTSAGNIAIANGNLVPSTAAKGVNFTANTPAAGMTSQLLNWYEEGTWTPTVTSGTGAITSYFSAGRYTRIGSQVTLTWYVGISNNGTGGGYLNITGAPFSALVSNTALQGWNQSSGASCTGGIAGTTLTVYKYDGTYPVATGETVNCAVTYFV